MSSSSTGDLRVRMSWRVLCVLLALEALLLIWVTAITVREAFSAGEYLVQSISLIVMAALSLLWVGITFVGAARTRMSWVRGSSLTIHVLLFAAGTGCLQLAIGPAQLGFGLVAIALAGFVAAIIAKPETPEMGQEHPEAMPR